MVKFTLASAFLILAYLFTVVSAAPQAHLFRISNLKTSQLIFSDGSEQEGDIIFTVPNNRTNVRNSVGPTIVIP